MYSVSDLFGLFVCMVNFTDRKFSKELGRKISPSSFSSMHSSQQKQGSPTAAATYIC